MLSVEALPIAGLSWVMVIKMKICWIIYNTVIVQILKCNIQVVMCVANLDDSPKLKQRRADSHIYAGRNKLLKCGN
jgi:hypothetical protein